MPEGAGHFPRHPECQSFAGGGDDIERVGRIIDPAGIACETVERHESAFGRARGEVEKGPRVCVPVLTAASTPTACPASGAYRSGPERFASVMVRSPKCPLMGS